jgi:hypothetical protein
MNQGLLHFGVLVQKLDRIVPVSNIEGCGRIFPHLVLDLLERPLQFGPVMNVNMPRNRVAVLIHPDDRLEQFFDSGAFGTDHRHNRDPEQFPQL